MPNGPVESQRSQYESNVLPRNARVVICGGGVMGASVAYHLALQGLGTEVVLLEQDRFVTSHVEKNGASPTFTTRFSLLPF